MSHPTFFHKLTRLSTVAMLASTVFATSAYADRRDDDDWHDRGLHRGWEHQDRGRDVVVVERPRYVERDVYVNNYPYYQRHHHPRPVYVVTPPPVPQGSVITCTNNYNPLPTIVGATGGGILGAQIGHGHGKTAAIISGALIGGALGNQYTYADQVCTRRVFETAQIGAPLYWNNPDTGYNYAVTPVRDYRDEGRYCREYTATARVGGRTQETYGTACMQPDGTWEIMN